MTRIWSGPRASMGLALVGLAAGAHAATGADLPARTTYTKAPLAASTVYDWSGFYLGGQIGGVGERNDVVTPGGEVPGQLRNYAARFIGGGYAGYNMQLSSIVLGIEADISGVIGGKGLSSSEPTIVPGIFASTGSDPKWLATVAGRVGFAANNWLLYGKGGGAWMSTSYTASVDNAVGTVLATQSVGTTRSGWLVGGGLEYAWNQNWLSRVEYNYVDFGTERVAYTIAGVNNADYRTSLHIAKLGLAYKFGGAPVSKY